MTGVLQNLGGRIMATYQRLQTSKAALWLRLAFMAAILGYLGFKIYAIGWQDVLRALPANPAFYLIFVLIYLALPVSDILIYQRLWHMKLGRYAAFFLRKQVYNAALVGYSGEMVFCFWAQEHLGLPASKALSAIKDNNILSAMASNLVTVVLVAAFVLGGKFAMLSAGTPAIMATLLGGLGFVLLVSVLFARFHKRLIALPARQAAYVFGVHLARVSLVAALQVLQWHLVIPQAPVSVWLAFLTAQFVLTRIPFLPNKDLVFLGLTLNLTGLVNAPGAVVAGMFVAFGALMQLANLAVYAAASASEAVGGAIRRHRGLA